MQMVIERLSQVVAVQPHIRRQATQHINIADVLAALEERAKQRVVILPELAMAPRPVRGFMRAARARLYGWKLDVDAQLFCKRIDRAAPNIVQIVAVRIERRHRVRAQLEGAPDDSDSWIFLFQFTNGRLHQPAEWSNVVRKDFELYRLHNLHSNSVSRAVQRMGRKLPAARRRSVRLLYRD